MVPADHGDIARRLVLCWETFSCLPAENVVSTKHAATLVAEIEALVQFSSVYFLKGILYNEKA